MKGEGMLVFALRCVNFRFWSRLGCSGQNTIIFSRKGLFKGCPPRNMKKNYTFSVRFLIFYLLDSCNQGLKWSLLGVKKGWDTPRLVSFRGLIQISDEHPRLFHMGVPAPLPGHGIRYIILIRNCQCILYSAFASLWQLSDSYQLLDNIVQ